MHRYYCCQLQVQSRQFWTGSAPIRDHPELVCCLWILCASGVNSAKCASSTVLVLPTRHRRISCGRHTGIDNHPDCLQPVSKTLDLSTTTESRRPIVRWSYYRQILQDFSSQRFYAWLASSGKLVSPPYRRHRPIHKGVPPQWRPLLYRQLGYSKIAREDTFIAFVNV